MREFEIIKTTRDRYLVKSRKFKNNTPLYKHEYRINLQTHFCECKGWHFSKKKTCKHLKAVTDMLVSTGNILQWKRMIDGNYALGKISLGEKPSKQQ